MLSRLKIENIAIIELADIEFSDGFNVLTGETGAGKSIIIDSINAVTGERTSKDLIRTGAQSARVTAVFESVSKKISDMAEDMGAECDGEIILSRTIKRDGKNICSVNGVPATVSTLKNIGSELINIHGQHDSQALLLPEKHCSFVDSFGSLEDFCEEYAESYDAFCRADSDYKKLNMDGQEKLRRTDMLTFQIKELEDAEIEEGEISSLKERQRFLQNARNIIEALGSAYSSLAGEGAGCDCVSGAAYDVERIADIYSGACDISQRLSDAKYELEDCCETLRDLINDAECDPAELSMVEDRLDFLHRLSLKYGSDEKEMLDFLENAKAELESINMSEEKEQELKLKRDEALQKAENLADVLTQKREAAGKRLSQKICDELRFLEMPNIRFEVSRKEKELCRDGRDEIEFLISANMGEELKPLAKTASGGELSRIMLAIKNSLAGKDGTDTMIFDEIDTGVSGNAARKIAEKLKEVSRGRQVICVTHLAPIASFADTHMLISKSVSDLKTYTKVTPLTYDERIHEIARLMGAGSVGGSILQSAKEMLDFGGGAGV